MLFSNNGALLSITLWNLVDLGLQFILQLSNDIWKDLESSKSSLLFVPRCEEEWAVLSSGRAALTSGTHAAVPSRTETQVSKYYSSQPVTS